MYYHAIPAPMNFKHAPAPFLVATFASGERELPTLRPAWDLAQAAEFAHREAGGTSRPVVRVYCVEPGEFPPVLSVRL